MNAISNHGNDKKLGGVTGKLHSSLKKFDLTQLAMLCTKNKPENDKNDNNDDELWDMKVTELKECNEQQMIYLASYVCKKSEKRNSSTMNNYLHRI
eukprot:TRINITY_DN19525_c0_g1_i1.p1 TRINITY_DN19525_c0_g1~~TRINITY_DN19525_c0_g1_i1.p1  ORF type:complete len:106 (+),score=20.47 TRINITY_DN19525_c0_g1_i1:32-319(+)